MKKIPSIWNLPSEEEVWKKMFSKSRPGHLLDVRYPKLASFHAPGRDKLCDSCWPNDCGCS